MPVQMSFDLVFLGLKDPSPAGRTRLAEAMSRITGKAAEEFSQLASLQGRPLLTNLSPERAQEVTRTLDEAGALLEVRPVRRQSPPQGDAPDVQTPSFSGDETAPTQTCPRCGFVQPAGQPDCHQCGLVFAKWEKEQVQKMQRDRKLRETVTKMVQVREEWRNKAKSYLERHPLPEDAAGVYSGRLHAEEIPFALLKAADGPILMTSRRMLVPVGNTVLSIPYELIADVDVGGFTLKKDLVNLQLKFHGLYPLETEAAAVLKVPLAKASATLRDVVMDWAFARSFVCGSCGEPDLDFRIDRKIVHARCMHCATDHEIDLDEAVAIPLVAE